MSAAPMVVDDAFARSVLTGLAAEPRRLESKYLYDARGAELFDAICELDEYYPTRTETALLREHAPGIGYVAGPGAALVELGSGASTKSRLVLDAMERPRAYVPVDISAPYLEAATARLREDYPGLAVHPVVADFTRPFALPAAVDDAPKLLFFPGSTIGNFEPEEAQAFLVAMRAVRPSSFLVGVDLVKPVARLIPAYDDAKGVTAAFDRNLLVRINRELGADFEPDAFAHEARFDPELSRIEMHLVSRRDQEVRVLGHRFRFPRGTSIHTENSYKYRPDTFRALATRAGWSVERWWTDEEELFGLALLRLQGEA